MDLLFGKLGVELIRILQSIDASISDFFDRFFLVMTYLGDETFILILIILIFWCVHKRLGIQLSLVVGTSYYISVLVKGIFGWPRPFIWARQQSLPPNIRLIGTEPSGYSFPSGHAQSTGTTWGLISVITRRKILVMISIFLCIIIPLSRLYLGVHWPSDVIVGLGFGLAIVILYISFREQIFQYFTNYQSHIWSLVAVWVLIPTILVVTSTLLTLFTGHDPLVQNPGRTGGLLTGIILGLLFEQRFVSFTTEGISYRMRVLRGIIGLLFLVVAYIGFKAMFDLNTGTLLDILLDYVRYTLLFVVVIALTPWVFDLFEQKLDWKPTS